MTKSLMGVAWQHCRSECRWHYIAGHQSTLHQLCTGFHWLCKILHQGYANVRACTNLCTPARNCLHNCTPLFQPDNSAPTPPTPHCTVRVWADIWQWSKSDPHPAWRWGHPRFKELPTLRLLRSPKLNCWKQLTRIRRRVKKLATIALWGRNICLAQSLLN